MLPTNNIHGCARSGGIIPAQDICCSQSPQVVLQRIEDYLNGNAEPENTAQYKSVADAIRESLAPFVGISRSAQPPSVLPCRIDGCEVIFTCPEQNADIDKVQVAVSHNGQTLEGNVNKCAYYLMIRAHLLRQELRLPPCIYPLTHKHPDALPRIDLRDAALSETDLSGLDLSQTDMADATMFKAKLFRTNLREANLSEAEMGEADMREADLAKANLCNAAMVKANLRGANLAAANLMFTELSGADLSDAVLRMADLRQVYLSSANLCRADLCGAILCHADLLFANLSGAGLVRANLSSANLHEANLEKADMCEADLSAANLYKANLRQAKLKMAILWQTNLRKADLYETDLSLANLSRTKMSGARLNGADLTGVLDASPTPDTLLFLSGLKLRWDARMQDSHLNHLNNPECSSLLTMLQSIDERFEDLKLQLARELVGALKASGKDFTDVAVSMMDVLSREPWNREEHISDWLDAVCESYLVRYNACAIREFSQDYFNQGLFNQSVHLFSRKPALMFSLNNAFNCLVYSAMAGDNEENRSVAIGLYDAYLQQDNVRDFVLLDEFGGYGTHEADWQDRHAANYILLPARQDGPVILASHHTLQGLLVPNICCPVWNEYYLYTPDGKNVPPSDYPLYALLQEHYPQFIAPLRSIGRSCFPVLLEKLDMGIILQQRFEAAVETHSLKRKEDKLVTSSWQESLKEIFQPHLKSMQSEKSARLTEAHIKDVLSAYAPVPGSNAEKLLCLAALFIRSSSSAVFGTESSSPLYIRYYACALIEEAYQLDRELFSSEEEEADAVYENWKSRLLGLGKAFSCASILTTKVMTHLKNRCPETLGSIIPAAWH